MRRNALSAAVLASVVWWVCTGTLLASEAATLDDRVNAIARELMCPVCGGQTVAESGSQLAEQMRAIIRERLTTGETRDEIIAYFVGQFGEGVLAAPRPRGGGLAIWLVPPAVLGIGLIVLRRFIRRPGPTGEPAPPPEPFEVEQIQRELRERD